MLFVSRVARLTALRSCAFLVAGDDLGQSFAPRRASTPKNGFHRGTLDTYARQGEQFYPRSTRAATNAQDLLCGAGILSTARRRRSWTRLLAGCAAFQVGGGADAPGPGGRRASGTRRCGLVRGVVFRRGAVVRHVVSRSGRWCRGSGAWCGGPVGGAVGLVRGVVGPVGGAMSLARGAVVWCVASSPDRAPSSGTWRRRPARGAVVWCVALVFWAGLTPCAGVTAVGEWLAVAARAARTVPPRLLNVASTVTWRSSRTCRASGRPGRRGRRLVGVDGAIRAPSGGLSTRG
jgi:hypothetical protein